MDWASHMQRILLRLGEDVVCTLHGGSQTTVRGVFLRPFQGIEGGMVESSAPRFVGLTADLSEMEHEDLVVRGGVTYTVSGIEPDGTSGLTELSLKLKE